jgi:hypothetical protein
MNAFLSYSMNDKDQYILTILSNELNKKGFTISQSNDFSEPISSLTKINIGKADLFIGLITGKGSEQSRVIAEWRKANSDSTPTILLIEDTVVLDPKFKSKHIIFNRRNPNDAIQTLNIKIEKINSKKNQDANAWKLILGTAALLMILDLFSSSKK